MINPVSSYRTHTWTSLVGQALLVFRLNHSPAACLAGCTQGITDTLMLWSVVGPQLAVLLSQPLDLLHQRLVHGEFLHQTVDLVQLDVKLSDHLHLEVDDVSVTGVSAVLHGVMDHVLDEVDLQGGERSSR